MVGLCGHQPLKITYFPLKLGVLRGAGEWNYIPDIPHARCKLHKTFETEAETTVYGCPKPPEVQVPPELFFIYPEVLHLLSQHIEAFFPLGPAYNFADSREKDISAG